MPNATPSTGNFKNDPMWIFGTILEIACSTPATIDEAMEQLAAIEERTAAALRLPSQP